MLTELRNHKKPIYVWTNIHVAFYLPYHFFDRVDVNG